LKSTSGWQSQVRCCIPNGSAADPAIQANRDAAMPAAVTIVASGSLRLPTARSQAQKLILETQTGQKIEFLDGAAQPRGRPQRKSRKMQFRRE
jgi:hypothetical protein